MKNLRRFQKKWRKASFSWSPILKILWLVAYIPKIPNYPVGLERMCESTTRFREFILSTSVPRTLPIFPECAHNLRLSQTCGTRCTAWIWQNKGVLHCRMLLTVQTREHVESAERKLEASCSKNLIFFWRISFALSHVPLRAPAMMSCSFRCRYTTKDWALFCSRLRAARRVYAPLCMQTQEGAPHFFVRINRWCRFFEALEHCRKIALYIVWHVCNARFRLLSCMSSSELWRHR